MTPYHLKKTPVALVVIGTIITLGLYPIYWFWQLQKNLTAQEPSSVLPDLILYMFAVSGVLGVGIEIFTDMNSSLLDIMYGIAMIVLSFKTRTILASRYTSVSFSGVATFFLTLFYLQYKINRLPSSKNITSNDTTV